MDALTRKIRRAQLDNATAKYRDLSRATIPHAGWVKAVREALGMSLAQFSRRMGLASPSNARQIEQAERDGSITLRRLRAAADALGCDLVVALVPRGSLEEAARDQARKRSAERLARVTRTMDMEDQSVARTDYDIMLEEGALDLLGKEGARLWD